MVRVTKTWQLSEGERGGEAHGRVVTREGALPHWALHEQGAPADLVCAIRPARQVSKIRLFQSAAFCCVKTGCLGGRARSWAHFKFLPGFEASRNPAAAQTLCKQGEGVMGSAWTEETDGTSRGMGRSQHYRAELRVTPRGAWG